MSVTRVKTTKKCYIFWNTKLTFGYNIYFFTIFEIKSIKFKGSIIFFNFYRECLLGYNFPQKKISPLLTLLITWVGEFYRDVVKHEITFKLIIIYNYATIVQVGHSAYRVYEDPLRLCSTSSAFLAVLGLSS